MAYIVPRVLIEQEFTQVPIFTTQPLSAFVFGPQYNLYRYSNSDEKVLTAVTNPDDASLKNVYQSSDDVTYEFPNRVAGTFVDADYTKVYFEKAQVEYYPNDLDTTAGDVSRVAVPNLSGVYYPNRFVATDLVFKTANGQDRSDDFSNRNVQQGDYIVLNDGTNNATVRVKALHATRTAAAHGTITNDSNNKATISESHNAAVVYTGSNSTPADAPANSSTHYYGHPALGIVSDVYTVEVTAVGSVLADVRFKITSAAGAFADKLDHAVNGSDVLVLDNTDDNVVQLDYTSASDPAVGDKYTLSVHAAVTRLANGSTITAATPYTGLSDANYILKVVRGGPLYDGTNADVCAKIAITSNGLDSSPTVNVQSSVAFRVGSYGLTATISASTVHGGLILGDIYYIPVTAATDSYVNIVETYESLPASLVGNTGSWEIVSMRYVANFEVPSAIDAEEDLFNWTVDAVGQTITINSGITSTNDDIVTGDTPLDLDVITANIFVEHRDLVITNTISIGSVTTADEVEAKLGTIDPDNPLAQGVYNAALNANGVPTYFCGVASDDLTGYNKVLALSKKGTSYYSLAPLTFDRTIQDAVVAHVNAMSTAENAKWRIAWICADITETALIYDAQEDDTDWVGTITADPLALTTQYSLLTVSGASFITDGVRPTDQVLINFRTNPDGKVVHDTYVVSEVRTEETLVITTPLVAAINSSIKVQIQRVYTQDEQIAALGHIGSDYNNRRVRVVFPTEAKNGDVTQPGYFIAAALAGLRAGVVPHQGLTNTELLGFTDLTMSVTTFNEDQLNALAGEGYWIVTQDVVGATPYVRHQLTTDMSSLNTSEDSITTNTDSISYGLQIAASPFVGKYNTYPGALVLLRNAIDDELFFRSTETFTIRAGNQLNGYTINSLKIDPTRKDRVLANITLDEPYPMNFINIDLIV